MNAASQGANAATRTVVCRMIGVATASLFACALSHADADCRKSSLSDSAGSIAQAIPRVQPKEDRFEVTPGSVGETAFNQVYKNVAQIRSPIGFGTGSLVISRCHVLTARHVVAGNQTKVVDGTKGLDIRNGVANDVTDGVVIGAGSAGANSEYAIIRLNRAVSKSYRPLSLYAYDLEDVKGLPASRVGVDGDMWLKNGALGIYQNKSCEIVGKNMQCIKETGDVAMLGWRLSCSGAKGGSGGPVLIPNESGTLGVGALLGGEASASGSQNDPGDLRGGNSDSVVPVVYFADIVMAEIRLDLRKNPCN